MSMINLVLGPLTVHGAQGQQNLMVAGVPGPTAFAGFAHALGLRLTEAGYPFRSAGIAVAFHDAQYPEGHAKFAPSRDDLKSGKEGASIIDAFTCNFEATLIIRLAGVALGDEALLDFRTHADEIVRPLLTGSRLAGGTIVAVGGQRQRRGDAIHVAFNDDDLQSRLKRTQPGWLLTERADLFETAADPLDALLDAVELIKDGETWERRQPGWVVPLAVGYQALERPTNERISHRDPERRYPHAFVESVTGLGEFVSLRRAVADGIVNKAFWRHESHQDTGLYRVTTEPLPSAA